MDMFEEAVAEYLTHEGKIFVCPQFRGEGFVADFVAFNFEDNPMQVEIVEVNSETAQPHGLVRKLQWYQENKKQTMDSLRNRLPELNGLGFRMETPLVIRVFIQQRHVFWFREHLNGRQNVIIKINSLDKVFQALLDWQKRTLANEG
jgi:hypothetical protein